MTRNGSLAVMESYREPRATTNPYICMVLASLRSTPGLAVEVFSWRRALTGRVDVFHVHWPETLITANSLAGRVVRQALMAAFLLRLQVTRTPVVRTQHNLHRPAGISRSQNFLLAWVERLTVHTIVLNESTPVSHGGSTLIRHGHYRDWFARYPMSAPVPGRFGYFGLIRHYKRVDLLIAAFRDLAGPYSLLVAGKPSSDELAAELRELAAGDGRVSFELKFLSDAELVRVARTAEVVVLPYPEMHNSGAVLAALSCDRPVLVPRNEVNDRLAEEVGADWVMRYDGELHAAVLADSVVRAREVGHSRPDLSLRDWSVCGPAHAQAFRAAVQASRHGR